MMRRWAILLAVVLLSACVQTGSPRFEADLDQAARINTQLGLDYLRQGNIELASSRLNKALEQNDKLADTHWGLALVHAHYGEGGKARRAFDRARSLAPEDGNIIASYGQFLCDQGELDAAEQQFAKALSMPRYTTPEVAYGNAAACYQRNGDVARAEENFRRALVYNPRYARALRHLAAISYERQDYLRARAFLQRLEAQGGHSLESLVLGLRTEHALGDRTAVQAYADELLSRAPDIGTRIDLNTGEAW
ncbi:MAG: type IV pilus biogenesis/stability protein PilW [Oceanococcus sp.]|nr:MAG: type IV pilus biogenesis/stability protein PilW [Oceanococcus sp.]